ncbi:hypothetical protein MAM1_0166d07055 [Mucor ambiguus]|uniref:Zinc finger PHD-type domain-containing protein n=1 Tax=Mucor ambiguus TaxID=91626 RepID=A0A0C9LVX9_9FUNG|nr:hypothetical protein MAM1_0166d07055 [Mucor ambiguus]
MKSGATSKGLPPSANVFNTQKTNVMVFSSIDNQQTSPHHYQQQPKKLKSIQPNKPKEASKENWNSHVFVSSPYDQPTVHHPYTHTKQPIKVIPQTFTTNVRNEKTERTIQRPTMGGKTIGAIHHLPANTAMNHHNRMSSEELKLLSRRIDPHEPLASPHASPRKPPLPNIQQRISKKRLLQQDFDTTENEPPTKKTRQFTCEPCNKVYKTRNGFIYHKQKCKKIVKFEINAIIECVCEKPADDTGTMVECTKCNKWLHLRCSGGVTKEDDYCCPRCSTDAISSLPITSHGGATETAAEMPMATSTPIDHSLALLIDSKPVPSTQLHDRDDEDEDDDEDEEEEADENEEQHVLHNGKTITLSALCHAQERGKNLFKAFQESAQQEQEEEATDEQAAIKNHFNFMSLFSDELNMDNTSTVMNAVDSPTLPPSSIIADNEDWNNDFSDFNSSDWCNEDVPSLLFSSDNNPSFVDDFLSSDIPSSPNMNQEADWLHFANFNFDFTSDGNQ